jgi:hypothetical protein
MKNMAVDIGIKGTDKYTDSKGLTKASLVSTIRSLQKTIRKGAASNEYMHESKSFLEARDRRSVRETPSIIDAEK